MLRSINPATGDVVAEYAEMTSAEVRRALAATARAFASWSGTSPKDRADALDRVAHRLRERRDELARLITIEMGKPLRDSRAEVEKCARACDYYAARGPELLADRTVALDNSEALVSFRPLGPLLAIMPWNFPFWQTFRAAAPALAAGNTVLLKLAANTTGCALAIEEVVREAGVPPGVFITLRLPSDAMKRVIRHRAVAAVTLTGSAEAGRKVAQTAGAALKKTVLELGGSDPYVILEDADIDLAARTCAQGRLVNAGQSCIAAKRFIVVESVREAFTARLVEAMQGARLGDPMDESTTVGPLARPDLRDSLQSQVQRSIEAGARLLCGGQVPGGPGAFYPPTVLADVKPGMPAFDEETFGPVAAVVAARDEAEAVALANQSPYGLGSGVFTRDPARARRIAREALQSGLVAINGFVQSDPRVPFGGVKDSGYGRELGEPGIREFVNIKTVLLGSSNGATA